MSTNPRPEDISTEESLASVYHGVQVPNVLCYACIRVLGKSQRLKTLQEKHEEFEEENTPTQEIEHYERFSDFKESARTGCHLCIILLNSIHNPEFLGPGNTEVNISKRSTKIVFPTSSNPPGIKAEFWMALLWVAPAAYGTSLDQDSRILYLEYRRHKSVFDENVRLKEAQLGTSTESSLPIAQGWLEECCNHHKSCSVGRGKFNPTRLLDLQVSNGIGGVSIRITKPNDAPLHYLALSHCWGDLEILTLTSKTMSRLLTGIDLKTLPKTFRHAVQISRRLGFRYLWIDALCILQDSIEDWRNEASKMGSVYEYSTCTIAAVWGRNSHSGCFNDRQPLKQYPCCVQLDSTGPLYLHDLDYVKDIHSENNVEGLGFSRRYESIPPLHTRAWVVQERFLAPRTIFFGSNVISWECREGTANELRPKIEREEHNPKECYQYFTNPLTPLQDEENRVAFYRNWNVFLWLYTAGRLTKEQDRLVALAGVVSQVEKHTGLTNIFGLWKELLPMELLWGRDLGPDGTLRIPPPKKTRAPSWSWASQDGPVNVEQSVGWESCVSEIVCETISSISIPTTKYPCISLLGHLVLFSGRIHTASVGINGYCELSHDEHKRKLEFTPDVPGAWEDDVKFDCYLLLVASTDSDEVFPGSVYEKGLVLSKRPSGRFARTGVFLNFLQTVDETGLFQKHRGERERITIE